jgi:hypothetical protein
MTSLYHAGYLITRSSHDADLARLQAEEAHSMAQAAARQDTWEGDGVGTGWEDGGWEAHPQVKEDASHSCVAWRGKTACDASRGVFERAEDRGCTDEIPYDVGGHCECTDPRLSAATIVVREEFECQVGEAAEMLRDTFTCSEICRCRTRALPKANAPDPDRPTNMLDSNTHYI